MNSGTAENHDDQKQDTEDGGDDRAHDPDLPETHFFQFLSFFLFLKMFLFTLIIKSSYAAYSVLN